MRKISIPVRGPLEATARTVMDFHMTGPSTGLMTSETRRGDQLVERRTQSFGTESR